MGWDERLAALFEDLEQQAAGLHMAERDAELAERGHAEYAQVTLVARLHASQGRRVRLDARGLGTVSGDLARIGADWVLLRDPASPECLVRLDAVRAVYGTSGLATSEPARPVTARLSFRSAMRGLLEAQARTQFHHLDGARLVATALRVGEDFVEVQPVDSATGGAALLPFRQLAAVTVHR